MSEAKYKVGDVMTLPHHSHPLPIAEVVTCYRFVKDIGALRREEELIPYVPPLGVGDRVRWHRDHLNDPHMKILAIDGDTAWCKRIGLVNGYVSLALSSIERIPTEAGQ
jgi:hypothetical protein